MDAFSVALADVSKKVLECVLDELECAKLYRAAELTYRELIQREPGNAGFCCWLGLNPFGVYGVDADYMIDSVEEKREELEDDDDYVPRVVYSLAPDYLQKQHISGGSPYEIELPPLNVFDALDPDVLNEAQWTTLVGYLRACFEWGGFPLLRVASLPVEEIYINYRVAFENVAGPWGPPAERLRQRLRRNLIAF